jgi:hypothetical protein
MTNIAKVTDWRQAAETADAVSVEWPWIDAPFLINAYPNSVTVDLDFLAVDDFNRVDWATINAWFTARQGETSKAVRRTRYANNLGPGDACTGGAVVESGRVTDVLRELLALLPTLIEPRGDA